MAIQSIQEVRAVVPMHANVLGIVPERICVPPVADNYRALLLAVVGEVDR